MSKGIDSTGVEHLSKRVGNPDDTAKLVKKIEKNYEVQEKLAYHQGIIFRKFKDSNDFMSVVTEFKISKSTTINFKIDNVNVLDKHPKMQKSCISLFYLKNNFRIIKRFV